MGHVQKLSTFLFVLALALCGRKLRAASFSASLSVEEGRLEPRWRPGSFITEPSPVWRPCASGGI